MLVEHVCVCLLQYGGAVYVVIYSTLEIAGSLLNSSSATYDGGVVYATTFSTILIDESQIRANTADVNPFTPLN